MTASTKIKLLLYAVGSILVNLIAFAHARLLSRRVIDWTANSHHSRPAQQRSKSIPFPDCIGAAGDSVTQAFDLDFQGTLQDNPQDSSLTGTNKAITSEP